MTIVTETETLRIASATDVGRRRTGNEDAQVVWAPADPEERERVGILLVVADGMGGANAGEVASQIATDVIVREVCARSAEPPDEALRAAIETANAEIHAQANQQADQRGMGTTCTALLVRGHQVWMGHVGDSRAYLVRGGAIQQLTRDHSLVAELVERGHLTLDEAKHDPRRNVVTRSVGASEDVHVDSGPLGEPLQTGDALVVCSDGLHGQVADDEIASITSENPPDEACLQLIELANARGGPDNITVIVAQVVGVAEEAGPEPYDEGEEPARPASAAARILIGLAILAAAAGLAALALGAFRAH